MLYLQNKNKNKVQVGIYIKSKGDKVVKAFNNLINILLQKDVEIWLNEQSHELYLQLGIESDKVSCAAIMPYDLYCLITIGGDGTFLSGITEPDPKDIPTLGVNTGKLGFLADISPEELVDSIDLILTNDFEIEKRSILKANVLGDDSIILPHALNEIAILKNHAPNMIRIHTYIEDDFLTSYWADGLIISTPTGSTAYSMSAGGPIVHPNSKSLLITPIAPHNLSHRPIIIPDTNKIRLVVESLDKKFLVSIDANSHTINNKFEIEIQKSEHYASVIKLKKNNFYNTLRNKLMWGIDKRN